MVVERQGKLFEPKHQISLPEFIRRLPKGYQRMRDTAYISVSTQNNKQ